MRDRRQTGCSSLLQAWRLALLLLLALTLAVRTDAADPTSAAEDPAGDSTETAGDAAGASNLLKRLNTGIVIEKHNVWVGYHNRGGGRVPMDAWVPVHLVLRNHTEREFVGELSLSLIDRATESSYWSYRTNYSVPVVLGGHGSRKHVVTHIYIPSYAVYGLLQGAGTGRTQDGLELNLRLIDPTHGLFERTAVVYGVAEEVLLRNDSMAVREPVLVLSPTLLEQVLTTRVTEDAEAGQTTRVLIQGEPESLPRRWIGYSGFRTIVVDGADLTTLDPAPAAALRDWVAAGGHLVVATGEHRQLVLRSVLTELMPCEMGEALQRDLAADLLDRQARPSATLCRLTPKPDTLALPLRRNARWSETADLPLAVRGRFGAGTVTAVAFSFGSGALQDQGVNPLWQDLADRLLRVPAEPLSVLQHHDLARDAYNHLRVAALKRIPSRGDIVLFLVLYFVLLVPGSYYAFRRLGRLELAWLAMPLLSLGFFFYMSWVALADLDDSLAITDMTVAAVGPDGEGGAFTASMLYNPGAMRYDIDFPSPSATPDHLRFSVDYRDALSSGGEREHELQLEEVIGRPEVRRFAIPFNDKRPLAVTHRVALEGGIDVQVTTLQDVPAGRIDNRSGFALQNAMLVQDGQAALLKPLPPKQTTRPQVAMLTELPAAARLLAREATQRENLARPLARLIEHAVRLTVADDPRPWLVVLLDAPLLAWRVEDQRIDNAGLSLVLIPGAYDKATLEKLDARLLNGPKQASDEVPELVEDVEEPELLPW